MGPRLTELLEELLRLELLERELLELDNNDDDELDLLDDNELEDGLTPPHCDALIGSQYQVLTVGGQPGFACSAI
jgi:hypothetical protein